MLQEREGFAARAPELHHVKHQGGELQVADYRRLQKPVDLKRQVVVLGELRLGGAPGAVLTVERVGVLFQFLRARGDAAGGDAALVEFPRQVLG